MLCLFVGLFGTRGRGGSRRGCAGELGVQFVELLLSEHTAVAVELGVQFHLEALDVEVAVHGAAALEREGLLDVEIALHRTTDCS